MRSGSQKLEFDFLLAEKESDITLTTSPLSPP